MNAAVQVALKAFMHGPRYEPTHYATIGPGGQYVHGQYAISIHPGNRLQGPDGKPNLYSFADAEKLCRHLNAIDTAFKIDALNRAKVAA